MLKCRKIGGSSSCPKWETMFSTVACKTAATDRKPSGHFACPCSRWVAPRRDCSFCYLLAFSFFNKSPELWFCIYIVTYFHFSLHWPSECPQQLRFFLSQSPNLCAKANAANTNAMHQTYTMPLDGVATSLHCHLRASPRPSPFYFPRSLLV